MWYKLYHTIIFCCPDIHHDDEGRQTPPQKANLAGNKSFYSKSLIIAPPLNFRQKSCPGNIFLRNGILAERIRNPLHLGILVKELTKYFSC